MVSSSYARPPSRNINNNLRPNTSSTPSESGIGCLVASGHDGNCVITKIVQGGAAALSGQLSVGDIIVSIDGRYTLGLSDTVIKRALIGQPGTPINLVVRHAYSTIEHPVTLIRKPLEPLVSEDDEIAGIGAVIAQDVYNNIVVTKLIYGGAAGTCKPSDIFGEDRLHRGDIILAVNGRSIHDMTPSTVRPLLNGPVGSPVVLLVKVQNITSSFCFCGQSSLVRDRGENTMCRSRSNCAESLATCRSARSHSARSALRFCRQGSIRRQLKQIV
jgi:C-terminal processing protease CtpA/Prc